MARGDTLTWQDCFDHEQRLEIGGDVFCVFSRLPREQGKVQGGGADMSILCVHGSGHCACSFAIFAKVLGEGLSGCAIHAFDTRGHGSTRTRDDSDLSQDRLSQDLVAVSRAVCGEERKLLVVGHSGGGAIAVQATAKHGLNPRGIVLVDVIEEMAVQGIARERRGGGAVRPESFATVEEAVDWAVMHGMVGMRASAQISIPKMLKSGSEGAGYVWVARRDASANEHAIEWYRGVSSLFAKMRGVERVLVVPSTEHLDQDLLIGQMQGLFQVSVVLGSGHAVQEERPGEVAGIVAQLARRM